MIMDDTTTPNSTLVSNTTVMAVEMARNCIPVSIIGLVSDTILAGSLIFLAISGTNEVRNGHSVSLSSKIVEPSRKQQDEYHASCHDEQ